MISVIIATKNRPGHIRRCIGSLSRNTTKALEILVIDQSTDDRTRRAVTSAGDKTVAYVLHPQAGKSDALNDAIRRARGDILAFTDDDCIVSLHWLSGITRFFGAHPEADGVLGSTYPYAPNRYRGMHCPSIYTARKSRMISRVAFHATKIGFGNNMAIRRQVLAHGGGFRTWLGPGTIGLASEDAETELRLLLGGHILGYDPSIRVFHDRWLSAREDRIQNLRYTRGEHACYGYFLFQGHTFARPIMAASARLTARRLTRYVLRLFRPGPARKKAGTLWWELLTTLNKIIGLCVGWYFAKTDPLRN